MHIMHKKRKQGAKLLNTRTYVGCIIGGKCVYNDEVHKNVIYIHLRARIQTTMHMKRDIILFYYSHSAQFGLFNRPLCAGCSGRY